MTEEKDEVMYGRVPVPDPTLLTTQQLVRELSAVRAIVEAELKTEVDLTAHRINAVNERIKVNTDILGRLPETIEHEINLLRTTVDAELKAETNLTASRFEAVHNLVSHARQGLEGMPSLMDEKVIHLKNLHEEKFNSIATQFIERDVRTEQTAAGVKIAVDAALQAAKEAVGEQNRSFALATAKSEAATTKQIDAQALSIQTAYKGLDDKIIDMKDRLTRIEAMGMGMSQAVASNQTDRRDTVAANLGGQQNTIAIAALVVAFVGVIAAIAGWIYTSNHHVPEIIYQSPPAVQRQSFEYPNLLPQYTFRNVDLNK